jgi:hypothetical protein
MKLEGQIPDCNICETPLRLFFRADAPLSGFAHEESGVTAEEKGSDKGWVWKCTLRFKPWHHATFSEVKGSAALQRVEDEFSNSREERMKVEPAFEYYVGDEESAHLYPYRVWTPTHPSPPGWQRWITENITDDFIWCWAPATAPRLAKFKSLSQADQYASEAVTLCMESLWKKCDAAAQASTKRCRCGRTFCTTHHPDPSEACPFCKDMGSVHELTIERLKKMNELDE